MAGLWNLSNAQLHDLNGKPIPGALAEFYAADSLDPITVYENYDLSVALPNPVRADAFGFFPAVFLDEEDGFFRQRLKNASGVVIGGSDQVILPIIGPTEGGGGSETPVDTNSLSKTGDLKWRLGTGVHSGHVRVNGRTIGSASSGATERANADCEPLYTLIWGSFDDSICPVTGGRGANAAADFAANKPIQLPDARGCTIAALDDMGNSAAGRLTSAIFSTSGQGPTILGARSGAESHTLSVSELPAHDHGGNTGSAGEHTPDVKARRWLQSSGGGDQRPNSLAAPSQTANTEDVQLTAAAVPAHTHTISSQGGGASHKNVQPTMLATLYVRL